MTRDEQIAQTMERCYYKIEMQATDDGSEDVDGPQSAIGAAITSHDGSITLLTEITTDREGNGVVLVSAIDQAGDAVSPVVLDSGTGVMIST